MNRYEVELARLLDEHGAVLKRTKKHLVYGFPDGSTFTVASTPSDVRAVRNQIRDLKHRLGLVKAETTVGERREKRTHNRSKQEWIGLDAPELVNVHGRETLEKLQNLPSRIQPPYGECMPWLNRLIHLTPIQAVFNRFFRIHL